MAVAMGFALLGTHVAHAQATRPAGGGTAGAAAISLDALMKQLDRNGDGVIQKEEATGVYAQRFPQWDADNNGVATREEIRKHRASIGLNDDGSRAGGNGGGAASGGAAGGGAAGRNTATTYLKVPEAWRAELMPFPPTFAPDISGLKGVEEARFAPGMYDVKSDTYFTYLVVIALEGQPTVDAKMLDDVMQKYFAGLSASRAQRRNLKVDPAAVRAKFSASRHDADSKPKTFVPDFNGSVDFIDSFTDGRQVTLNIEVANVLAGSAAGKRCLVMLLSPSKPGSDVWKSLHDYGSQVVASLADHSK